MVGILKMIKKNIKIINLIIICVVIYLFNIKALAQTNEEWKTIYTFNGTSNENTDDFVIKSNKWRIVWEAKKQYQDVEGGNVFIILKDYDGEEDMIANTLPYNGGKTIVRKKGTFYFEVSCFLAKWEIKVQEPVSK